MIVNESELAFELYTNMKSTKITKFFVTFNISTLIKCSSIMKNKFYVKLSGQRIFELILLYTNRIESVFINVSWGGMKFMF
jgi:hypothetical protein